MANLTITAANVVAGTGATIIRNGTAGATVTRGQPLYKDAADSDELKPAQATSTKYACVGIALADAGDGQPVPYVSKDADFTVGATVVVGTVYAVSATAGSIAPIADLTTGDYVTVIGVATTTSKLKIDLDAGIQAAAPIA